MSGRAAESTDRAPPWRSPPGRTALVDHVVGEVRAAILRGDYEVGGELPAAEKLADGFGVSMTVIREAMRELRSQGLVEVFQGKRPLVAAANSTATVSMLGQSLGRAGRMEDLMQVRWVLEVAIAAIAAEKATTEHLIRLAAAVDEMRDGTTVDRQVDADVQFHRVLAEATGNPLFPILLQSLEALLREFRRQAIEVRGVRSGIKEHAAVLEAVRSRDPQAAREAMIRHMKLAERTLRKELPAGR